MIWFIIPNPIIFLLFFSSCTSIKVPVLWEDNVLNERTVISEIPSSDYVQESDFEIESFRPQNVNFISDSVQKPIPIEYFAYTARKPQFAVEVAAFHNVKNPDQHYRAYPVKPHTGVRKPVFGKHYINDPDKIIFDQFQSYANNRENYNPPPIISNYEIFHPYKAEEPALNQLYKDPTLLKIRNDIRANKNRLQNYEKEAGESDVSKEEHLQGPEEIDQDKFPIKNEPARYEIYKPQRRPIYYKRPQKFNRDRYLNKKFKHPLYQHYVKIRPASYRPLKNHIHNLKQEQAQKYDDEHNEYPQVRPENIEEPSDGYDIYEKGKERYVQLRNNVDDEVNKAALQSKPVTYANLELQNDDDSEDQSDDDEEEAFVPIKSYAQVRKTETTKHLPREAALQEAENYEEIENAPRLREAVKSTKSQTVYSEEGYEDTAYDHAGEQKHASDHEAHGGFLKENEKSRGKFKAPEESGSYSDRDSSEHGDKILDGKKWENNEKDIEEELDDEGTNQDDYDESIEADIYDSVPIPGESRNHDVKQLPDQVIDDHDVNKRDIKFKLPEFNFSNTLLTEDEILNIPKNKEPLKDEYIKIKYPYYKKLTEELNKHSPLRYAESLKRIPLKTRGGTEFYDSRSLFQCPEVDEELDPIPENVKEAENKEKEGNEEKRRKKRETDVVKEKPRLKGLGDKIDCFKAKYFGENPLDSPFFKEEIISNPDPISIPNIGIYKLTDETPQISAQESKPNNVYTIAKNLREQNKKDIFDLIEKLKSNSYSSQKQSLINSNTTLNKTESPVLAKSVNKNEFAILSDIIGNIHNISVKENKTGNIDKIIPNLLRQTQNETNETNVTYNSFKNKEDVTQPTISSRRKRSSTFVYEPYKVVRDNNQSLDSKKTTTLSNISPLIKQLQSSRVVEVTPNSDENKRKKDKLQPVKRNVRAKQYKDIGRKDRSINETKSELYPSFTDVNIDNRKVEPSFEFTYSNHKNTYTPVENKKSVTADDYVALKQQNIERNDNVTSDAGIKQFIAPRRPTTRPYFDVSQFLPKTITINPLRLKTAKKIIHTTTSPPAKTSNKKETPVSDNNDNKNNDDENDSDESEEYYDDEEDEEVITSTTVRSPLRVIKQQIVSTTTTQEPEKLEVSTAQPVLKLITRFRKPTKDDLESGEHIDKNEQPVNLSEKSKKSTKSTLVTDTKRYGDGDDDMRKDEIDAMIGVQHDMKEYMPQYEKQEKDKSEPKHEENNDDSSESEEDEDFEEYEDDDDEEEEEEDDDDDEDEDDDVSSEEITDDEPEQESNDTVTEKPETPKDVEARSENKLQPIILKKKIEIHKELPLNKSLPYTAQYKEDIVEEETIKKVPKKNLEALELYKDDSLAKKVNKLADVEIFKADLRLNDSPKHGGNYRRHNEKNAEDANDEEEEVIYINNDQKDTDTSQTKSAKLIQIKENSRSLERRGNAQIRGRPRAEAVRLQSTVRPVRREPEKPVEIVNLRSKRVRGQRQKSAPLEKLQEKSQEVRHSEPPTVRRRRIQSSRRSKPEIDESQPIVRAMHGGNLKALTETNDKTKSANILNSFAQAVPVLTTTPAYIIDPSKRMYYYVDA